MDKELIEALNKIQEYEYRRQNAIEYVKMIEFERTSDAPNSWKMLALTMQAVFELVREID